MSTKTKTKSQPVTKKIHPIVGSFLAYNRAQSTEFVSPKATLIRRQHRNLFPVPIAVMKCMDGRVNLATITGIPAGIIQSYRDLGGKFDIGAHFGEVLGEWVNHSIDQGKDSIILVTYHWSKGDPHLGCKGFGCNVEDARRYVSETLLEIQDVFGEIPGPVWPIKVGIETDRDALVIHGVSGEELDLAQFTHASHEELRLKLEQLFPKMDPVRIKSLLNLCEGNIHHIREIEKKSRAAKDLDHAENIIGIGRGFGWHNKRNEILLVGPYRYDMAESIATQARIMLENIKKGRIPSKTGFALISSAVFRDETGPEQRRMIRKSRSLLAFAEQVIRDEVGELVPYMTTAAGVLNDNTRLFTLLSV